LQPGEVNAGGIIESVPCDVVLAGLLGAVKQGGQLLAQKVVDGNGYVRLFGKGVVYYGLGVEGVGVDEGNGKLYINLEFQY